MKITAWRGCEVVQTFDVPHAPGPDVAVDPWAGLVSVCAANWSRSLGSYHSPTADATDAIARLRSALRDGQPVSMIEFDEALDQARAEATTTASAHADPMDGAIDRLREAMGDAFHTADVSWALNEAFRNGLRRGRAETLPDLVYVSIPGLDAPRRGGEHFAPLWTARKGGGSDGTGQEPYYRVEGDPNAVAVGRFKASLRKFLGID